MARQFEQVDDFEDDSRPPVVDLAEWVLNGIFAGAGAVMLLCALCLAVVEYMR